MVHFLTHTLKAAAVSENQTSVSRLTVTRCCSFPPARITSGALRSLCLPAPANCSQVLELGSVGICWDLYSRCPQLLSSCMLVSFLLFRSCLRLYFILSCSCLNCPPGTNKVILIELNRILCAFSHLLFHHLEQVCEL